MLKTTLYSFKSTVRFIFAFALLSNFIVFHFSGEARQLILCSTCPKHDFAQTVAAAQPFDTIIIKKGTYRSINTIINKPLIIIGENFPVIDGQLSDEVITILSNNVIIKGLDIRNSSIGSMKDFAGLRVFRGHDIVITGNHFNNTFFGIYLSDASRITVSNNKLSGANYGLSNTGNGIQLWKCDSIHIINNHIEGHRDGIYFEFAHYCLIENNYATKNFRYGLHFMFSDNDTYINNTFDRNGTGVAVMYTKHVYMYNNKFINNWGDSAYGLLLKDIGNSVVEDNTFSNNTIAMHMEGTSNIRIKNNNFLKNGYAIKVMADCIQDTFVFNNFSANTFDCATNGTLNLNFFDRNYWNKYNGYDLNKDGIGDIPYRPISLFSQLIEQMPQAVMLMHSFIVELLDKVEQQIPTIVPETILDNKPFMKQIKR